MHVNWLDDEETIALIDYHGPWTWEEAYALNQQAAQMVAAKPYRCDLIGNMRSGTMNSIVPAIETGRKILALYPSTVGLFVMITNPIVRMLLPVFASTHPGAAAKLRTAASIEQARAMIAADRAAHDRA